MGRNKFEKKIVPHRTKLKKDPGIPRLPDLKARNEEKKRVQGSPPYVQAGPADPDSVMAAEPTLSSLALLAQSANPSSSNLAEEDDLQYNFEGKTKEQIRRHYVRALHKVIDDSDVVVLVLDARDPEGCRSRLVEEEVRRREAEGKRLVFVLNKIDLVPRANAQAWLRHLRHSTPTLPFRSATSHARGNLSSSTSPALLRLLKAYKHGPGEAPGSKVKGTGSVTVGVVGYPNVGKSSLINTLKRAKVCPVASQPGHTQALQSINLERGLRIVDSPGVIFDDDDFEVSGKEKKKNTILLRNVVKVEDIEDPVSLVDEILARTEHERIQKIYNIPEFGSTMEFLTMLALSQGKLLKGGTPDLFAAARQVLNDWNHQKIPFHTVPPTIHPSSIPSTIPASGSLAPQIAPGAENVGQAQILTQLGQPFMLAGLFGEADAEMGLGDTGENEEATMEGVEVHDSMVHDEVVPMEAEESFSTTRSNPRKRGHSPDPSVLGSTADSNAPSYEGRAPKRMRKLNAREPALGKAGGMQLASRKKARMDKKKKGKEERRAHTRAALAAGSSMEIEL
ncbi:P-loop containing nucleoside triphosphate hydrolase protein [Dentipellis sp. KUC8613]|nr:P-loop containing nucleoside triphosphate hydrolase protein [Dentipellis sp. KUC8613]